MEKVAELPEDFIRRQNASEVKEQARTDAGRSLSKEFLSSHGEDYVALKEAELALRRGLPHLYGFKWYPWALKFFNCREKLSFLCAANQISKSSTQIRKCVDWATDTSKWDALWPGYPPPNQFWYLYPTANQATIEFEKKWKTQFLPRGEYKDHAQYGWSEEYKNKEIFAIHFKTGVTVYFKSYKQGGEALQTGTVYAVFLDEECPEELWDELVMRKQAVDGYIHMVFTATLGQEMWRQAMEPKDEAEEKFKDAFKLQVSMYDCQIYVDGSTSHWTNERINQVISSCKSPAEVSRRVFGRFVKDSGLKYGQFDVKKHMKPAHKLPGNWLYYLGADIGSGGDEGHPSAICIVAVNPDFRTGRVIFTWRGDGIRTTASDVYTKAEEALKELRINATAKYYDWSSAEFGEISSRNGGGYQRAEKSHDIGEKFINVLFRNDMMAIYETGQSGKLAGELSTVTVDGPKNKKKDDLSDAFRYAVTKIPWDWSVISGVLPEGIELPEKKMNPREQEVAERRKAFESQKREEDYVQSEFDEWNSSYEG